ncbi:MAG: ABC transporter permease [Puia sp.]|nr:ABC transporter permease [Puia sp.]
MFKNYLKIAWRNLGKQKILSFISVFGLSLGIACFSLCLLYSVNEFSFDSFHRNARDIYRVNIRTGEEGGSIFLPMPAGPALKRDLPGVENYIRYIGYYTAFLKTGEKESRGVLSLADPSFFSAFSFKLKSGDPATALQGLQSLVLTEETARNLFGTTDVVGKTIRIKIGEVFDPFTITGIAENPPSNTSFQFRMLGNFDYFATTPEGRRGVNNWNVNSYVTYLQLKPGSRLPQDKKLLEDIFRRYFPLKTDRTGGSRPEAPESSGPQPRFGLQPLTAIHTDPNYMNYRSPAVDPQSIWILLIISAGVLLIASINFTTLAIGRSADRAKEVGVRKVMGGSRKSLVFQFLTESVLLAMIAGLLGFLLANGLLPFFRRLSGRELSFSFRQFPQLYGLMAFGVILTGILAGSYPALLLSRFRVVEVLKAKIKLGGGNLFTKTLVTLQFILSAGLIIGTLVIMQQLHYMQTKDPGFNKENVVVVEALGVPDTKKLYPLFKQELSTRPEIVATASADCGLGELEGMNMNSFRYNGKSISNTQYSVSSGYLPLMDMRLLAGRNFSDGMSVDTVSSVIINETMMKELGWTIDDATGRRLTGFFGSDPASDPVVIGVVKDFNYLGMQDKIEPQLFSQFSPNIPYRFFVRIRPGDPSMALAAIQKAWKNIAPDYPLQYNFLNEDLDTFYKSETRLGNIVGWAGGISVSLACMGLFGLASLAAINRTKEVGIRKVLGASVTDLVTLLSRDFLRLVVIAFLIAAPFAGWLMNRWLSGYAYRIGLEWWVFAITGICIAGIALLTVGIQAIKTALSNPVNSLRSE